MEIYEEREGGRKERRGRDAKKGRGERYEGKGICLLSRKVREKRERKLIDDKSDNVEDKRLSYFL